jgi:predicted Rossmann-fold nucleotide-binding protein
LPGKPGDDRMIPDADIRIFTGMGFAPNRVNILSSDVIIALPGSHGTLTELAYPQTYAKPTVLLKFEDNGWFGDDVVRTNSLADCVSAIRTALATLGS